MPKASAKTAEPKAQGFVIGRDYKRVSRDEIENASDRHFVIRTIPQENASFRMRTPRIKGDEGSQRSAVLALVKPGRIYSFRKLCEEAAHISGAAGLDPVRVRAGLHLHSYAKPACVAVCYYDEKNVLRFAYDYRPRGSYEGCALEMPNGTPREFKKGDAVPAEILRTLGKGNGAPRSKGKPRNGAPKTAQRSKGKPRRK